ncbi:MAG: hypothetical protein ACRDD7_08830 [Peptostreptococcaceae bacterium]
MKYLVKTKCGNQLISGEVGTPYIKDNILVFGDVYVHIDNFSYAIPYEVLECRKYMTY